MDRTGWTDSVCCRGSYRRLCLRQRYVRTFSAHLISLARAAATTPRTLDGTCTSKHLETGSTKIRPSRPGYRQPLCLQRPASRTPGPLELPPWPTPCSTLLKERVPTDPVDVVVGRVTWGEAHRKAPTTIFGPSSPNGACLASPRPIDLGTPGRTLVTRLLPRAGSRRVEPESIV